jgi:peptide/nickel transport system substrate-binding protein
MGEMIVTLRRLVAVTAAVALIGGLASCGTGSLLEADEAETSTGSEDEDREAEPQRGGQLIYGLEADPNGLDPTRNAFDLVGIQVANAVYDTITAFDATGQARPYLAESVEPVEGQDFRQWRIRLRPGVRFHSGRPLDAMAGKVFLDAIIGEYIDPTTGLLRPSITQQPASYIAGADVVNDHELLVNMHKPWSTFPALLAGQGGYLISPEQIADPDGHSRPDGTGPFMLRSWAQGEQLSLIRNPDYWRAGLPYLDRVDFQVEPEPHVRIAALEQGDIDVIAAGTVGEVRHLEELMRAERGDGTPGRIRMERDTGTSEAVLVMLNTAKKPLDSELVRQALAYATDVESLARENGWSQDRIISGPFPPSSRWYVPTEGPRFDLAKARSLVEEYKQEAGVEEISFELLGAHDQELLRHLQAQWSRAGIDVRISMTEQRRAVPMAVGGFYDAIQLRHFAAVDPDALYHFWTSETRRDVGELSVNLSRYANEDIDEALERSRTTTDEAVRREAYAAIQRTFARAVPYLWLFRSEWVVARSHHVRQARNVTLPDGRAALALDTGTHRLTETWLARSP